MSVKTKIQWCDSTANPTMGCDGCELWNAGRRSCYAGMLHVRFGGVTPGYAPTFEQVTQFPGRMAEAARWSDLSGKLRPDKPWLDSFPRLIFVSDMSDSLSADVPFGYLHEEIITPVISEPGKRHHWLWLTKRPERMAQFSAWLTAKEIEWPGNLWAGTSITTQATTTRIESLLKVGNSETIRFLSVEPQIEPIDLGKWLPMLSWVIQGGESGRKARPFEIAWAVDLSEQCKASHVPYFLKQLGSVVYRDGTRMEFTDNHAGDWSEWPKSIRRRQMPSMD
jgi:protein gp37